MAQLVEWLILTPENRGSNPVIDKKIIFNVYCQLYCKDENKEKEAGNSPFKKIILNICCQMYWKDENKEKRPGIAHFEKQ